MHKTESNERTTKGRVSVVYFGNDWFAENRTSSHHIAKRMATKVNLLYVDSPGMRAPSGNKRDLRRIWVKLTQALRPPQRVEPGLWHCTVPQLPWRSLPGVAALNRWFGGWAVRRAMRIAGLSDPVLWFLVPHPSFMLNTIRHRLAVYYCIDDYAAHPGVDVQHIQACDQLLTERADLVFVAPPALVERKRAVNASTVYSPHGVDVELFARALSPETVVPPVAAALAHPVIGYFGLIAPWTNLELLLYLARSRPQWQFLMVGHASVDVSELAALPNVCMVGPQPYETLPQWAKAFDVAIIPYRLNQQVANANPLKLREYLATGKPVVSVRTAEVDRFGDLIRVADTPEQYLLAVEEALTESDPLRREARMNAVKSMSWDHRVDQTWMAVEGALVQGARQRHGTD
jgi:glycosyltransferase involved in cell wall biosynthesis